MKKRWHGGRAMLNRPGHHGMAAVVAEVRDTSRWKDGCDSEGRKLTSSKARIDYPDAELCISDCSRTIYLTMDFGNKKDCENSLYKLDTMIVLLQDFRDGVEVEGARYIERKKVMDKARRKREKKGKGTKRRDRRFPPTL